jgi:polyisoprenoid-binding protein YceI
VSSRVDPEGEDRWRVAGELAIHGQTRTVTLTVTLRAGQNRGATVIRQRDFGIEPISIAGGTVKVKDELSVESDIVAR